MAAPSESTSSSSIEYWDLAFRVDAQECLGVGFTCAWADEFCRDSPGPSSWHIQCACSVREVVPPQMVNILRPSYFYFLFVLQILPIGVVRNLLLPVQDFFLLTSLLELSFLREVWFRGRYESCSLVVDFSCAVYRHDVGVWHYWSAEGFQRG